MGWIWRYGRHTRTHDAHPARRGQGRTPREHQSRITPPKLNRREDEQPAQWPWYGHGHRRIRRLCGYESVHAQDPRRVSDAVVGEDGCAECSPQRELQRKRTWDGVYTAWIGIGPQTGIFRIIASFLEITRSQWEEPVSFASSITWTQTGTCAYEGTGCACCYRIADVAWEAWECILGCVFWVCYWCGCRFWCGRECKWNCDEKGMGRRESAQGSGRPGSRPGRRSR